MTGFFASSAVQREKPAGLIPKCGSCGLFKSCQSPKMPVYGSGGLKVMIVGEAPGATEDEQGVPFVGKAGQHLRSVLGSLGVRMERDTFVTNSLICRPPNNATPDDKQIAWCRPNLLKAIRDYEPRVVVTLGRSALASVLGDVWKGDLGPLERWVGWKIPHRFWICPTYHPSYLLRMNNQMLDRLFSEHLEAAFAIEDSAPEQPNWEERIELIYDDTEAARAIEEMDRAGGFVAVDYETNCIKPEWSKGRIHSCALSNGKRTIAYPWTVRLREATDRFLCSDRTQKISSNMKMEERWTLKEFGHGVRNWGWDTMLAAHCLDNRPGICSLKFQAFVKLGVPTYNERIEPYLVNTRGPYNRIEEIELRDLLLYNGMDALLEHRLAMVQREEMGL